MLIDVLQPDILVKGGDYDAEEMDRSSKTYIVGSHEVRANDGDVAVIKFVEGHSTTNTIKKIRS